jgi:hypothetical protein
LLQDCGIALVPLKVTVLVPCVDPKFVPLIVIKLPTVPELGEAPLMPAVTVKVTPLLTMLWAVTTTGPVAAAVGTEVTIVVLFQLVTLAAVPLKLTVPEPWGDPKFVPVIVTEALIGPDVIDRLVILGGGITVKLEPLLFTPLAKTTTFPVIAPVGTVVAILVALQLVTVAAVPWKLTVPEPWVDPKFVPVIVTAVPTPPEVTERLVILGVGRTVKLDPPLFTPLAKTTTFPVVAPDGTVVAMLVALQVVIVAAVPWKLTVPEPCEAPKFVPVIVITAPTAPDVIDRLEMLGAETTVKLDPLLSLVPT